MNLRIGRQKIAFKADLFDVRETNLYFPTGKKKVYYDVYRDSTVLIFPVTNQYELYLVTQFRYLYKQSTIEAIAGHINKKESALSAAKRELGEEAGIEAVILEEFGRLDASGSVVHSTIHFFLAKELEFAKSRLEDDEDIEVLKVPLEKAVDMIFSGKIKNCATVAGILMLNTMRKENRL